MPVLLSSAKFQKSIKEINVAAVDVDTAIPLGLEYFQAYTFATTGHDIKTNPANKNKILPINLEAIY